MKKTGGPRLVEITFALPPRVVKKLDEYAETAGWSREEFLRRFVDVELDELHYNFTAFCLDRRQNRKADVPAL